MCGITGLITPTAALDLGRYYRAHDLLRHRGPDDEGFAVIGGDGVGHHRRGPRTISQLANVSHLLNDSDVIAGKAQGVLGHHRLSIIDLSETGHQPMSFDGLWMVYNGEVYNYRELREELLVAGYDFVSDGDSEVVLKSIHHWGPDAFSRFNGFWALALWNPKARQLMLSRDRFGIKPLYFAKTTDTFAFASETKFFKPLIRVSAHEGRMREYVRSSLLDHDEETMLAPVRQLMPAHYATLDVDSWTVKSKRYWSLPTEQARLSEHDAIEQFDELFRSSIDFRMRADVPVGALLSGGLDSTAIVANLCYRERTPPQGMHTFSAVFPNWEQGEDGKINETIKTYGQLKPHFVEPTAATLMRDFNKLLYQADFPLRSSAVHSQYLLYEEVRANSDVVVLLNGQGADEIFGGYNGHRAYRIAEATLRGRLLAALTETRAEAARADTRLRRVMTAVPQSLALYYLRQLPALKRKGLASNLTLKPFLGLLAYQLQIASLPEYLRYEDRNSMAHACESRLPFLDHRLVEWAFRLVANFKINNGQSKYVQRQGTRDYVPEAHRTDPIKKGFISPQYMWQRNEMADWMRERLSEHSLSFVPDTIVDDFDNEPKQSQDLKYWRVVCQAEWLQNVRS